MSSDLLNQLIEQAGALTAEEKQLLISRLEEQLRCDADKEGKTHEPPEGIQRRKNPHDWIRNHFAEYEGQWVALDGDRLLAYGTSAREVLESAKAVEEKYPFLVKVEASQGTKRLNIPDDVRYRTREYEWLKRHRNEYSGEYLALEGDHLIAHGKDVRKVLREVHKAGAKYPLMVYVESEEELPFGGW